MTIPWFLALAVDSPQPGPTRILRYHKGTREDEVPQEVAFAPTGALFLLQGSPGDWRTSQRIRYPERWPADLPALQEIRASIAGKTVLPSNFAATGKWSIDPEGRPCELGQIRLPSSSNLSWVLNYAGWRLTDLSQTPIRAYHSIVDGRSVFAIVADDVPVPLASSDSRADSDEEPRPAPQPHTYAPPPLNIYVAIDEVVWQDGYIRLPVHPGNNLLVPCEAARAAYEPLKEMLAEELKTPLRIYGSVAHPLVDGTDGLERMFERARRKHAVFRTQQKDEWIPAEDLVHVITDRPDADPEEILILPELEFSRRADALTRLFKLRSQQQKILVWKAKALLIPVAIPASSWPYWIWEVAEEGYATYIFRPTSEDQRKELQAWAGNHEPNRHQMITDPSLQEAVGYVGRAVHRDGDDTLDLWWKKVVSLLQRGS